MRPQARLLKGISGQTAKKEIHFMWQQFMRISIFYYRPRGPNSTRQVISIISILQSTSKFKKFDFNRLCPHIDSDFESTIFPRILPPPSAKFLGHFGLAAVFDTCFADTFCVSLFLWRLVLYKTRTCSIYIDNAKEGTEEESHQWQPTKICHRFF